MYIIVCLYVDDIFILGNNDYMIKSTKKMLTNKLDTKILGDANVILKIKIFRTFHDLVLSQSYYVERIPHKFFKGGNSIVKTLMDMSVYMSKNKDK
jgi:hypothetical protein